VISVRNLGKEYFIGRKAAASQTFREMLVSVATAPFGRAARNYDAGRIWALRDLNFDIREGEVVGIIGRNGAGKSTLLKILSRITEPTTGRAEIRGRVSSLLEVGTGFHPELTGRENIYLNGVILGMSRSEIQRKFDEIVEFSGVEQFLDLPVKRYSSGMAVRLAFAVAAHLEPEILIIDEVLAVGDAEFQRRCLGKIKEVSGGGRTVLFVSHNISAVAAICGRGIVMKSGRIEFDGGVDGAVAKYMSDTHDDAGDRVEWRWSKEDAPGNHELRLVRISLKGERSAGPAFRSDEAISIGLEYEQSATLSGLRFVLRLMTEGGETAFATSDQRTRVGRRQTPGRYRTECVLPANLLNRKPYIIQVGAEIPPHHRLIPPTDIGRFFVEGMAGDGGATGEWPGVVHPKIEWKLQAIDQVEHSKAS
jgi:lipopolysaccharide transport system ATP-binding protein